MKRIITLLSATLLTASVQAQSLAGKIVFSVPGTTGTGASGDTIYSINADGSDLELIDYGCYPRVSPNGKYLTYLSGVQTDRLLNDIYFREYPGGSTYQFYDNGSHYPIRNFDFTASTTHFMLDWQNQFYYMDADMPNSATTSIGGGAGDLTDEFTRVSPTDSSVASHNYSNGLYRTPYGGSGSVHIPNTVGGDISPSWSPNGTYIYYGKQYSTGSYTYKIHNIYRIKPDGSGKTQITNLPNTDTLGMAMVVTKDNKWIVVTGRIHDTMGIWKFRIPATGMDTSAYLVRAFPHIHTTTNFWLGSVDSVTTPPTAIAEMDRQTGTIFPNPVSGKVFTINAATAISDLELYDMQGRMVRRFPAIKQAGSYELEIPDLQTGIYYLRGKTAGGLFAKELLIAGH